MTGSTEGCTYCGSDEHNTTSCPMRSSTCVCDGGRLPCPCGKRDVIGEVIAEALQCGTGVMLVQHVPQDQIKKPMVSPAVGEHAMLESVPALREAIAQRDARIEELEAHCVRLGQGGAERYWENRWRETDAELATLKDQPSGVVMPDELTGEMRLSMSYLPGLADTDAQDLLWRALKVARLNACQVSADGADEPYMWVRVENDCIEDYTQDKGLAADWMQEEWPVTFPLYRAALAGRDAVPDGSVQISNHLDEVDAPAWEFINAEAKKVGGQTGHIDSYQYGLANGGVIVLWDSHRLHAMAVTVRDDLNRTRCIRVLAAAQSAQQQGGE